MKKISTGLLAFTFWASSLSAKEALTKSSEEKLNYTQALEDFKLSYSALAEANIEFSRLINPHIQNFETYRTWMEQTTQRLSKGEVTDDDIQAAFVKYRRLLKDDKTCASANIQILQTDIQNQLNFLSEKLVALKSAMNLENKKADKKQKKILALSTTEAESAYDKASKTITEYSKILQGSSVCATLANYDLVLVAADTLSYTKKSAIPLKLSDYLDNSVLRRERDTVKTEAQTYLQAVELGITTSLERGDVSKSLILLNRLDANLAFGTAAAKYLGDSEKQEIDAQKSLTRQKIRTLTQKLSFPKPETFLTMVQTKAKLTHGLLTQLERESVRGSDQNRFEEIKSYCKAALRMTATEPFKNPSFRSNEDVLEYDAQLDEVQVRLKELIQGANSTIQ